MVVTGLSGSGKSSLAFDTIYAEGQRRYIESLSAYARQFLGMMEKPDVDAIEGLSPAISIEQKSVSRNPRSTVGTVTEIYDYLRLLYARAGTPYCPRCDLPIQRQPATQIVEQLLTMEEGTRIQVLAPLVRGRKGEFRDVFERARRDGFVRALVDGRVYDLRTVPRLSRYENHDIGIIVDRLVVREEDRVRLSDSVETALRAADGVVQVLEWRDGRRRLPPLQRALRLRRLRRQLPRTRTPRLLLQLASRGLRGVRRPGHHQGGERGARRGESVAVDPGGCDPPLGRARWAPEGLGDPGSRAGVRVRPARGVARSAGGGARGDPAWIGPHEAPLPVQRREDAGALRGLLGGGGGEHRTPLPRDRFRARAVPA